ncbi:MAG: CHASE2 domain-containing protein [Candidatus Hydrogenedentota bacterium]
MSRKLFFIRLISGLMITLVIFWLIPHGMLQELELELLYKLRGTKKQDTNIWIISIDKEIEGGKPISHKMYAKLIDVLTNQYKASAIGFDIYFSTDKKNDPFLAKAIKSADCVFLGIPFSSEPKKNPHEKIIERFSYILPEYRIKFPISNGFINPFLHKAYGIGHINLESDKTVTLLF